MADNTQTASVVLSSNWKTNAEEHQSQEKIIQDLSLRLQAAEEKINTFIIKITKDVGKSIKLEEGRFETKTSIFEVKLNSMQESLKNSQIKIIETLSLFAALLTFVTSDISVFKSQNLSLQKAGGLTLILSGVLVFFILLMNIILKDISFLQERSRESVFILSKFNTWGIGLKIWTVLLICSLSLISIGILLIVETNNSINIHIPSISITFDDKQTNLRSTKLPSPLQSSKSNSQTLKNELRYLGR